MNEWTVIGGLVAYWLVVELLYALLHDKDTNDVPRKRTTLQHSRRGPNDRRHARTTRHTDHS